MWQGDTPMNQMLLRAAIKDKNGTMSPAQMMKILDIETQSPLMPDWVHAWIEADKQRIWPPDEGPIHANN
jgi:hypothetical protein